MRIVLTASEINDRGCWERFCEERGIDVWAMNQGLMESSEEFSFTEEEAINFGFIQQRRILYR